MNRLLSFHCEVHEHDKSASPAFALIAELGGSEWVMNRLLGFHCEVHEHDKSAPPAFELFIKRNFILRFIFYYMDLSNVAPYRCLVYAASHLTIHYSSPSVVLTQLLSGKVSHLRMYLVG